MPRIALGLEYVGGHYHGWQKQNHATSVQEELEKALAKVANHPVETFCAGRTDTGVHALNQVVHFDSDAVRTERSWLLGANSNLPHDIAVTWVRYVDEDFHARFSAVGRSYRYILLSRAVRPAILTGKVSWTPKKLDETLMQQGADFLLGEHDYTSFRATECQAHSPVKQVQQLTIQRDGDYLYLDIRANGFLHHMVRNITGSLIKVGCGDMPPEWIHSVLEAKDRRAAGMTASADGLYFVNAYYPERFAIPLLDKPLRF